MTTFPTSILAASIALGENQVAPKVALIGFGFLLVFAAVYFWFLEEQRNRDIINGIDGLQSDDGSNAEFRQEAIFASSWLFLLTPLLIKTLNDSTLHLIVEQWFQFHIAGINVSSEPIQWLSYTLVACANTFPIVQYLFPNAIVNLTGIHSTIDTPYMFAPLVEALFAVFLVSIVVQQASQAKQRIQEAINALGTTYVIAAALGPRVIEPLSRQLPVLEVTQFRNAALAIAQITRRYSQSRARVRTLCSDIFLNRLNKVKARTKDEGERQTIKSVTIALASMDHGPGINAIRERILNPTGESYANRAILVDALAEAKSFQTLKELHTKLLSIGQSKLAGRVRQHLDPDSETDTETVSILAAVA